MSQLRSHSRSRSRSLPGGGCDGVEDGGWDEVIRDEIVGGMRRLPPDSFGEGGGDGVVTD